MTGVLLAAMAGLLAAAGMSARADEAPMRSSTEAQVSRLAGAYELQGVMEVGSGLQLLPDGRFRYFLAYGALDEIGEGRWTIDGERVLLTSDGPLTPPRFTLKRQGRVADPMLRVLVVDAKGQPIESLDVLVGFDKGEPETGNTTHEGFIMPLDKSRPIRSVRLGIRVYDLLSDAFPVDTTQANDLVFLFEPNDLGKVDFKAMPLTIEEDALVMSRGGTRMRYVRVGQEP